MVLLNFPNNFLLDTGSYVVDSECETEPVADGIYDYFGQCRYVSMLVLLFAKVVPLIPIGDAKEGMILHDEIKIGKVMVPAVMREE